MNANLFYTFFAFVGVACNARPQRRNGGPNFSLEPSDVDYLDYQQYQPPSKLAKSQLQPRPAKPRSPIVANGAATQNKVTATPPVAILKQINRHNEDGSYTYGFEGADGSFKIETKLASGEVIGKYGYVDDGGKMRVVEYGANKYGFQPAGEGITVPPTTITNDTDTERPYFDDNETIDEEPTAPKITNIRIQNNQKRKSQRPAQGVLRPQERQHQRPKSQSPSAYLVQELEEQPYASRRPETNQRQLVTPTDINSLQYLLGGDLRQVVAAQQYATNEAAQRKSNSEPSGLLEEEPQDSASTRPPMAQTFPIPTIFEMNAVAQPMQRPANNEFAQSKFSPQYEIPSADGAVRGAVSKGQSRLSSRPAQFLLISPMDDTQLAQSAQFAQSAQLVQPQTAVRRHSSRQENRSILDELLKQYAIPNMSAPINDYSFGYN